VFTRRIKHVKIVAGALYCYRRLALISLQMALPGSAAAAGAMRLHVPFLKKKFTQKD